jgi:hypothetical protein
MPLQYLLTDAILCLGGSTELLEFNVIGAVASLDTHDCYLCSQNHMVKGVRVRNSTSNFYS